MKSTPFSRGASSFIRISFAGGAAGGRVSALQRKCRDIRLAGALAVDNTADAEIDCGEGTGDAATIDGGVDPSPAGCESVIPR
jgi:hypothetical protein